METIEELLPKEEAEKVREMLDKSAKGEWPRLTLDSNEEDEKLDLTSTSNALESTIDSGIDSECINGNNKYAGLQFIVRNEGYSPEEKITAKQNIRKLLEDGVKTHCEVCGDNIATVLLKDRIVCSDCCGGFIPSEKPSTKPKYEIYNNNYLGTEVLTVKFFDCCKILMYEAKDSEGIKTKQVSTTWYDSNRSGFNITMVLSNNKDTKYYSCNNEITSQEYINAISHNRPIEQIVAVSEHIEHFKLVYFNSRRNVTVKEIYDSKRFIPKVIAEANAHQQQNKCEKSVVRVVQDIFERGELFKVNSPFEANPHKTEGTS